jgi:hypothetical protein
MNISVSALNVNESETAELLETVNQMHEIFWKTKKRDIAWYTADS